MVTRTISTICWRLTARASSRGAVPNTSPATALRRRSGCLTQSTKAAIPACATRPIQDRFSADMLRNHGSRCSMDVMAAVPSEPMACCSRLMVSSRTRPAGVTGVGMSVSGAGPITAAASSAACPARSGAVIPPDCHVPHLLTPGC